MIHESDVREKLAAIADQRLPLEDFGDWLASASWNMHADSLPDAVDLVSSIHLLLSEYDHGDLSETELRAEFLKLRSFIPLRFHFEMPAAITVPLDWFPETGWSAETLLVAR